MATTTLVEAEIIHGEEVIRALDEAGIDVRSAFWFYDSDAEEWRLILSLPLVDVHGLRETYLRVQSELSQRGIALPLRRIKLYGTEDELVRLLRKAIRVEGGIAKVRFTNNVIDDVLIEDALIYRSS